MANTQAQWLAANCVNHVEISQDGQSVTFQQLLEIPTKDHLRITIHSDAYESQSYAKIEVWRDAWVELWRTNGATMHTPVGLRYKDNPTAQTWFLLDRNRLFAVAMKVLGS